SLRKSPCDRLTSLSMSTDHAGALTASSDAHRRPLMRIHFILVMSPSLHVADGTDTTKTLWRIAKRLISTLPNTVYARLQVGRGFRDKRGGRVRNGARHGDAAGLCH